MCVLHVYVVYNTAITFSSCNTANIFHNFGFFLRLKYYTISFQISFSFSMLDIKEAKKEHNENMKSDSTQKQSQVACTLKW